MAKHRAEDKEAKRLREAEIARRGRKALITPGKRPSSSLEATRKITTRELAQINDPEKLSSRLRVTGKLRKK